MRKRSITVLLVCLAASAALESSLAATGSEILARMKARRAQIDALLLDKKVGEQMDGKLLINGTCDPVGRQVATKENDDRELLFDLIAKNQGRPTAEIASKFLVHYVDRYVPGVNREIRDVNGNVVWWDGHPPDPRQAVQDTLRVLALEDAKLYDAPGGSTIAKGNIPYFSAYSVVSETNQGSETWYEVSVESVPRPKPVGWRPSVLGWMSGSQVIPWKQALVVRFTNPLGRDPSLFFRNDSDFERSASLDHALRTTEMRALRAPFLANPPQVPPTSPILAIEPAINTRAEREAFIYPILSHRDFDIADHNGTPRDGRMLEIAAKATGAGAAIQSRILPIDLVFVMDTTGSMGPYLQAVLNAAETFARNAGAGAGDLRFGFVGYRDNLGLLRRKFASRPKDLAKIESMEYAVRNFTETPQPLAEFLTTLAGVASVPTPTPDDVAEEVFAGVEEAITRVQWRQKAGKLIVLVGDAPGHPFDHEQSTTHQDEGLLRTLAHQHQVGIFAVHLKNSKHGSGADGKIRAQFTELSRSNENGPGDPGARHHYLAVDASDTAAFQENVIEQFREVQARMHDVARLLETGSLGAQPAPNNPSGGGTLSDLILAQAKILLSEPTAAIRDVTGWTSDLVMENPARKALTPMVLLTRTELDQLEERINYLSQTGAEFLKMRQGGATSLDFFQMFQSNSGKTMIDPTAVELKDAFGVPAGIEQLPYKSQILRETRSSFMSMTDDRLNQLISNLTRMRTHYQNLRRDRDAWKPLTKEADPSDHVAGLELDMLP